MGMRLGSMKHTQHRRAVFDIFKDDAGSHGSLKRNRFGLDNGLSRNGSDPTKHAHVFAPGGDPCQNLQNPFALATTWQEDMHTFDTRPQGSPSSRPLPQSHSRDRSPMSGSMQRYFSVVDGGEPQFFDSLPPHMEFGGLGGPRYLGTMLNPLNPKNRSLCQINTQRYDASFTSSFR